MKPSFFIKIIFTTRNLVVVSFCLFFSVSLNHSLFANDIVTVDKDSKDAYHLEVMQDLKSSEKDFFSIINDEDSSRSDKLEAKTRLASIYLLNKEFQQAINYLQEVDAATDLDLDNNKFISSARYNLGMVYIHGKGVEKDLEKAYHYFSKAGQSGNTPAVEAVVVMCINGEVSSSVIRRFVEEMYESYISAIDDQYKETAGMHLSLLAACPSQTQFISHL